MATEIRFLGPILIFPQRVIPHCAVCPPPTTPKVSYWKGYSYAGCVLSMQEAGNQLIMNISWIPVFPLFVFFGLLNFFLHPSASLWTDLHASRRSKVIRRERIWIFWDFLIPCFSAFVWKVYILAWLMDNDYMQTSLDMQMTSAFTNIYRNCTKWADSFMN